MPRPRVVTIGVYDWDLDSFLAALRGADVRVLFDVRQRRGVRGPQYAWANSQRLQHALAGESVSYRHHLELAPTTELRHLQYAEDARQGVGKRSRILLAPEYSRRYTEEILAPVGVDGLLGELPPRERRGFAVRRTRSRGMPPLDRRRLAREAPRRTRRRTCGRDQFESVVAGTRTGCAPVTGSSTSATLRRLTSRAP